MSYCHIILYTLENWRHVPDADRSDPCELTEGYLQEDERDSHQYHEDDVGEEERTWG